MAWTITYINDTSSKKVRHVHCVADAATYAVDTGLDYVEHFTMGISSLTTIVGLHIVPNYNCSGTATNGYLGCSGFSSGDNIYFTVYGR